MDELERLRRENQALNEQVKRLVRAERRLSLNRQELDAQLQRFRALNRFSLDAGEAETPERILELAMEGLFDLFPYEQALAFVPGSGPGRFRAGPHRFARSCGRSGNVSPDEITLDGELPRRPIASRSRALADSPLLPFLRIMEEMRFPESGQADDFVLMLPVIPAKAAFPALLVFRRRSPLSLLERLPEEEDFPFLQLVENHISSAIQNLVLFRDAQEAVRLRDEFLSIASHELNTPMTSILLLLQSLSRTSQRDGLERPQITRPQLEQLERQLRRLGSLVEQLLEVSRIRVGKLVPQYAELDLVAMIREVIQRFQPELSWTGSWVELRLPEAARVRADPSQLDQVMTNLISNAIKFGQGRAIEIGIEEQDGEWIIEVRDHGIGISARDQARIFDRFERAVSSRNFGGLGLGLYIARQILTLHGGRIEIESAEGQGSKFTVRLPGVRSARPGESRRT